MRTWRIIPCASAAPMDGEMGIQWCAGLPGKIQSFHHVVGLPEDYALSRPLLVITDNSVASYS